ncbi:MAG: riboflavin biosynthesis protein RibF [Planctomycetota bacterium]|jgi:riboflavin kinase/FMN adenylyltransferase
MRTIAGLQALESLDLRGQYGDSLEARSVVTVGVFDGVHLGHLRLLHELREMASLVGAVPTVITFRTHPDELLKGAAPPPIVSVAHRLRLLRRAGVERLVLLDFDDRLRELSARGFAEQVLVAGLNTKGLLLGFDSAMGKDRRGTAGRFRDLGSKLGFEVREGEAFLVEGKPVSSTMIRNAIQTGDLNLGQRLLGRWPSTFGAVVPGEGRGKSLGFPTANVHPQNFVLPPQGVYAVEVLHDGEQYPGVANLGVRPTFAENDATAVLEVHLLGQDLDMYGATIEVSFLAHLRDERRFPSGDALREQIEQDILKAREVFAS